MAADGELWLKFSGEGLDIRSVPIYELGDTLVALQRIINKVFLFDKERLRKHAQLSRLERRDLSLQILERRKSSDLYALIPFVNDPQIQQYVFELLKIGLGTLGRYALKKVVGEGGKQANVSAGNLDHSILIGAIYAETVQITNHIDNVGGISSIDLIPRGFRVPQVRIDRGTQDYVRAIVNESYLGRPQELTGAVKHLYPDKLLAQIKVEPGWYVKVALSEESFRFVRYHTESEQLLRFRGRPVIRLGKDAIRFQEFEADTVELEEENE